MFVEFAEGEVAATGPDETVPPELLLCPSLDALWAKQTTGPKALKLKASNKIDTKELILLIDKEFS